MRNKKESELLKTISAATNDIVLAMIKIDSKAIKYKNHIKNAIVSHVFEMLKNDETGQVSPGDNKEQVAASDKAPQFNLAGDALATAFISYREGYIKDALGMVATAFQFEDCEELIKAIVKCNDEADLVDAKKALANDITEDDLIEHIDNDPNENIDNEYDAVENDMEDNDDDDDADDIDDLEYIAADDNIDGEDIDDDIDAGANGDDNVFDDDNDSYEDDNEDDDQNVEENNDAADELENEGINNIYARLVTANRQYFQHHLGDTDDNDDDFIGREDENNYNDELNNAIHSVASDIEGGGLDDHDNSDALLYDPIGGKKKKKGYKGQSDGDKTMPTIIGDKLSMARISAAELELVAASNKISMDGSKKSRKKAEQFIKAARVQAKTRK